jgi:hypothetical protein
LPSKYKALSSNSSTIKGRKEEREGGREEGRKEGGKKKGTNFFQIFFFFCSELRRTFTSGTPRVLA